MNHKLTSAAIFLIGAAVGSAATWQYFKKKYEQIAREEIDSVKEAFSKRKAEADNHADSRTIAAEAREKPDVSDYIAKIQAQGYASYSAMNAKNRKEEPSVTDRPYVIAPEEFGEFEDYEKISLTWYADQVLADDDDEPVDEVEEVVGSDALTHFGEYEDDSVFVRNDRLRCDYEILLDTRAYSDISQNRFHRAEER